jgi:MFS family permease
MSFSFLRSAVIPDVQDDVDSVVPDAEDEDGDERVARHSQQLASKIIFPPPLSAAVIQLFNLVLVYSYYIYIYIYIWKELPAANGGGRRQNFVSTAFMFVQGPTSFYILRFLLGVTEAGFFPGVILYLTYWIPARHLSRARGYFYMGIALAGILGNPLSGGLLELNGVFGLRGIQWMFLVEGLLAVGVGVWSYFAIAPAQKRGMSEPLLAA